MTCGQTHKLIKLYVQVYFYSNIEIILIVRLYIIAFANQMK